MARGWSEAARARRRLRALERGYIQRNDDGFAHVSVPVNIKPAMRQICRSLETHVEHDVLLGVPHHYARHATLAAAKAGVIDDVLVKKSLSVHRAAGKAKHELSARVLATSSGSESAASRGDSCPTSTRLLQPTGSAGSGGDSCSSSTEEACQFFHITDNINDTTSDYDSDSFCPSILSAVQVPDFYALDLAFSRLAKATDEADSTDASDDQTPTQGLDLQADLSYERSGEEVLATASSSCSAFRRLLCEAAGHFHLVQSLLDETGDIVYATSCFVEEEEAKIWEEDSLEAFGHMGVADLPLTMRLFTIDGPSCFEELRGLQQQLQNAEALHD